MAAPTIDFDAEYRFRDGKTVLGAAELNRRFLSLHSRLKTMEQITYTFEGLATEIGNLGIERINALIVPLIEAAQTQLQEISGAVTEAQAILAGLQAAGVHAENVDLAVEGLEADNVQAALSELQGRLSSLGASLAANIEAIDTRPIRYVSLGSSGALQAGFAYRLIGSAPLALTLPQSPSAGDAIRIVDGDSVTATVTHTILRNGHPIGGRDEDLEFNVPGGSVGIWFNGTQWRLFQ